MSGRGLIDSMSPQSRGSRVSTTQFAKWYEANPSPLHPPREKEWHHQFLSLEKLMEDARYCSDAARRVWFLLERVYLSESNHRTLSNKFPNVYCWLCDKTIDIGSEVEWFRSVKTTFHKSCYEEAQSPQKGVRGILETTSPSTRF